MSADCTEGQHFLMRRRWDVLVDINDHVTYRLDRFCLGTGPRRPSAAKWRHEHQHNPRPQDRICRREAVQSGRFGRTLRHLGQGGD